MYVLPDVAEPCRYRSIHVSGVTDSIPDMCSAVVTPCSQARALHYGIDAVDAW
jgi:hypothetical protein